MQGGGVGDGKPAGVGIVFKEGRTEDGPCLVVKALAAGGAAEDSGQIDVSLSCITCEREGERQEGGE